VSVEPAFLGDRFVRWLDKPVPVLRLEVVRIGVPLAVLGFMSSRVAHADEWLGNAGFRVPDLGSSDYRQPLYIPALPEWGSSLVAFTLVASGLAVAAGFRARRAAIVFAAMAALVALSDRLAAFSVSKLAPVIGVALAASPCGQRFGVDAWLQKRKDPDAALPSEVASGSVRFFQVLLPVFYCASGIAKARGDWLSESYVLWSHLHDTYQTAITVAIANATPKVMWPFLQTVVLGFEALAPVWFLWPKTRGGALVVGLGMHFMIGLMFGPVRYFALLMGTLLIGAYGPASLLERIAASARRF
jgi:hypothetical protein